MKRLIFAITIVSGFGSTAYADVVDLSAKAPTAKQEMTKSEQATERHTVLPVDPNCPEMQCPEPFGKEKP